ncbi:methionine--tRNA ligase [bacterium]|nr:methionine--tRNA ligase [bacterium]
MTSKKYYITTAIDYGNAPPHIGHAYEKIAADALARYHRLRGEEVFFLTGLDEHGNKIEKAADAAGVTPQAFVDDIAEKAKEVWEALNIRYDGFIRTSDPTHREAVQRIFQRLMDKGDIFKAKYEGWYCKGCEEFKNERDLPEDKICPQHQQPVEWSSEENYVFKLSNYRDRLRAHIEQNVEFLQPEARRKELLNLLETFPDISVSRQNVRWGIPVPGDESQVIYVWIDALSNYLTGIGYDTDMERFNHWWPAELHLVGKDITKFHAIIWPALLMALDLPLPRQIFGHGWVNVAGLKMSKTIGNVIEPKALAAEYGADAIRYYLLREVSFGRDGDFTYEAFEARVNADLANNLGNALNRTLTILEKNFEGKVSPRFPEIEGDLPRIAEETLAAVIARMDEMAIEEAIAAVWALLDAVNKYIDSTAPWALAKNGETEKLGGVLYAVLEALRIAATLASPFIPTLAGKIWEQLGIEAPLSAQRWSDLVWGGLAEGTATQKLGPIYPRIGAELAGAKKKA